MDKTRGAIVSKGVGELRLASSEIKKPPEPSIFWRLNAQLLLSWIASEFVSSHCSASRKIAMRLTGLMHWEWVRCTVMHHLRQMSEMIILLFVICKWEHNFVRGSISSKQTLFRKIVAVVASGDTSVASGKICKVIDLPIWAMGDRGRRLDLKWPIVSDK